MQHTFDFYQDQSHRPKRPERLFFCLLPDKEMGSQVAQFSDRLFAQNRLRGSRLRTDRLHMTLHHIDDFKRLRTKDVYAAQQVGKAISMGPFEVDFRFVHSFDAASYKKDRRPLVLLGEGEGLKELFHALGIEMARYGLKVAVDFTPHMTLSYGPQAISMQAIEPIRFVARDFTLIHSRQGLTQYEVIDRWSLVA
jgi:2'-5' RNA ligase